MHELSITQSMVAIAERHAIDGRARRVLSVTVEIGVLSGVVADAVAFCFEACIQGTLLEGARLVIEEVAGEGECTSCAWQGPIDSLVFACPSCSGFALERTRGQELRLKSLEVE